MVLEIALQLDKSPPMLAESETVAIACLRLQSDPPFVCMAFSLRIVERVLARNVPGSRFVMQFVEQGFGVRKLFCSAAEVRIRLPDDHGALREDRRDDI